MRPKEKIFGSCAVLVIKNMIIQVGIKRRSKKEWYPGIKAKKSLMFLEVLRAGKLLG